MSTPREMNQLAACVCRFRRTIEAAENRNQYTYGPWETGIAVCYDPRFYDVQTIVDLDGKVVENVWDYELCPFKGAFIAHGVSEFTASTK